MRVWRVLVVVGVLAGVLVAAPADALTDWLKGWYRPVDSSYVSAGWLASSCGSSDDYTPGYYHTGIDYPMAVGQPVYAIGAGTVVGRVSGFGAGTIGLVVSHRAADGSVFEALYGHITSPLMAGDSVTAGSVVGAVGAVGGSSTGPHVHFGVSPGGTSSGYWGRMPCSSWPNTESFVDPEAYLNAHPRLGVVPQGSLTFSASYGRYTEVPVVFRFTIRNAGNTTVTMPLVIAAVRDPSGFNKDVLCEGGRNLTLPAGGTFSCKATGRFPWRGTYTYWAAWQDTGGVWHQASELWAIQTFTLSPSVVGVYPTFTRTSGSYGDYVLAPITFRYQIRNVSGYPIAMSWITTAVRDPAGRNRDAVCEGGRNRTLAAGETFQCVSKRTFYTNGTYTYWAAWQGPTGEWHGTSELWPLRSFPLVQSIVRWGVPTAKVSGLWWPRRVTFDFTIKNQAGGSVTLPLVFVAVRDPNGKNIDVACNGGNPVTIGAGGTYRCATSRSITIRGTYTYFPSWRDPEGAFHDPELWAGRYFTL